MRLGKGVEVKSVVAHSDGVLDVCSAGSAILGLPRPVPSQAMQLVNDKEQPLSYEDQNSDHLRVHSNTLRRRMKKVGRGGARDCMGGDGRERKDSQLTHAQGGEQV